MHVLVLAFRGLHLSANSNGREKRMATTVDEDVERMQCMAESRPLY